MNTNGTTIRWLVGMGVSVLLTFAVLWGQGVDARIVRIENKVDQILLRGR